MFSLPGQVAANTLVWAKKAESCESRGSQEMLPKVTFCKSLILSGPLLEDSEKWGEMNNTSSQACYAVSVKRHVESSVKALKEKFRHH